MSGYATPEQRELKKQRLRAWKLAHPELVAEQRRRYRERHKPEVVARERARNERRRSLMEAATGRRSISAAEMRRYTITYKTERVLRQIALAGRDRTLECECCGDLALTRWDHCHACGAFRGWICNRCNTTLGLFNDDPALLRALADFLERHTHQATESTPA